MTMNRIKKGDQVIVIAGKDKGKRAKSCASPATRSSCRTSTSSSATPSRIRRPTSRAASIEREAPIHISNVMLFNPASGKGERVGFKVLEDGRKVRVFRSSGEGRVDA